MADWVRKKLVGTGVDGHFFVVLDKRCVRGEVLMCRIGGRELEDLGDFGLYSRNGGDGGWIVVYHETSRRGGHEAGAWAS